MSNAIRIGLLVDSASVSKYVNDLIAWSNSQGNLSITHLIVHPKPTDAGSARATSHTAPATVGDRLSRLYANFSRKVFRALVVFESMLLRREGRHSDHGAKFDIAGLVDAVVVTRPIYSSSGLSVKFDGEDILRIGSLGLDVLIRCGGAILRGDILCCARFGVISFHHADNRINRGTPAAFWEVYSRSPTTGFTLQRLTEELDGGDVLMRGHFPTRHYYLLNQASLFERSNHYLKSLLERIATTGTLPSPLPSVPYSERLFRMPLAGESAIYFWSFFTAFVGKKFRRLLGRDRLWHVAYVKTDWRNAVLWRATDIPNPPGRYLADPFVIERNGKTYCFVEDLDDATRKGAISAYELADDGPRRIGIAIDEPFHLSFPFLFEYGGELFMCPESSANRDIRIYRCVEFPLKWELHRIAKQDLSAADTMIFELNDRWWMLTNIDPIDSGDLCSTLHIFHADSPLAEEWRPHAMNPVIVDAAFARNGGLLRDDRKIFRVAQRQGFDRYGQGSQINEIVTLTQTEYEERCIAKVSPSFRSDAVATHHMHSAGSSTVIDYLA